MTPVLFDTSMIIDTLNGREEAAAELLAYDDAAISIITWIEIMTGTPASLRADVAHFLANAALKIVALTDDISAESAQIRHEALLETPKRNLKLPDAIIQATALRSGRLLITRNKTDFKGIAIRVPYEIDSSGNAVNVLPPP